MSLEMVARKSKRKEKDEVKLIFLFNCLIPPIHEHGLNVQTTMALHQLLFNGGNNYTEKEMQFSFSDRS